VTLSCYHRNLMIATLLGRRAEKKERTELEYWRKELLDLEQWFRQGKGPHWGISAPREDQKINASPMWQVNAILTRHAMRPTYLEALRLEADRLRGKTAHWLPSSNLLTANGTALTRSRIPTFTRAGRCLRLTQNSGASAPKRCAFASLTLTRSSR
jgi:hypothetical protein